MATTPDNKKPAFEIFPWNIAFSTGIDQIDEQHQQLVSILNRLARHFVSGENSPQELEQIIAELADYADYHFRCEELIWHRHFEGHPMLEAHEKAHHDFFAQVQRIQNSQQNLEDFVDELFGFLTRWLAFHILDNDKRMALATLKVEQGVMLSDALIAADHEMAGSLSVLIRAVLDMYGELSANTIDLMQQKIARQRAEESLRLLNEQIAAQQLQLSEERYQVLFDAIPDAVFLGDVPSGKIIDANQVASALSGRSLAELRGMRIIDLHPAVDREFHQKNFAEFSASPDVVARFETVIERADGSRVDVEASIRGPFKRGDGASLVGIFRDISERKRHREALEFVAFNDELTGLLNRNGIKRALDSLLKANTDGQVLLIVRADVDNFTRVNERFGAAFADRLLQVLAKRLHSCVPDGSLVSRLGGDEFLAVLVFSDHSVPPDDYLPNFMQQLQQPLHLDDIDVSFTLSAGVKYCTDLTQYSPEVLMRQVAYGLYQAKLRGISQCFIVDQVVEDAERKRHLLLGEIEFGLSHQEFELYFQPKVHLPTGRVIGAEGLIRWHHPVRGFLTPGQFIDQVAHHPVAIAIDNWAIEQALRHLEQWREHWPDLGLSINVSAESIQDAGFAERLISRLQTRPLVMPQLLQIELLESSTMTDFDKVVANMKRCRDAGISIAIDDFGTGYSSLSYLKRLPVDWLKLDQSFVRDMMASKDDVAIIEGIVSICRVFNLNMIAEGVEQEAHAQKLIELGCHYGQGYVIAKPMAMPDLELWLKGRQISALIPTLT